MIARYSLLIVLTLLCAKKTNAQFVDYIERSYYQNAEAQNAALSAARYAEEAYFYTHQAVNRSSLDDFRADVDTVLFYLRKSRELAVEAGNLMTPNDTIAFLLESGKRRVNVSDQVLRHIYPYRDFGKMGQYAEALFGEMMHAKIDFYKASLYLSNGKLVPDSSFAYEELNLDQHVARLDADESAFTRLLLDLEEQLSDIHDRMNDLREQLANTTDPEERARILAELEALQAEKDRLDQLFLQTNQQLNDIRNKQQQNLTDGNQLPLSDDSGDSADFETDKHGYYDDKQVGINEPLPQGLVYRIQLGYFFKTDRKDAFHGLFPITGEDLGDGKIRYYAGMFTEYNDASRAKEYIRQKRIGDAFVVPYLDGKKINVKRAIEIERELKLQEQRD